MKNWTSILLTSALVLGACGDESPSFVSVVDPGTEPPGNGGGVKPSPGVDDDDDMDDDDVVDAGPGTEADAGDGGTGSDASTDDAGEPFEPWYTCQSSDQAFVRGAILAVLGRRPYSQAEVDVYTDLIGQIDAEDNVSNVNPPGSRLKRSRRVMLASLFNDPQYQTFWTDLYRDFIRVQRVDEMANTACFNTSLSADPVGVAGYIRSHNATGGGGEVGEFTMLDAIQGSLTLDDVSPIYVANLFAMLSKSYAGANAEPVSLEISRRQDFGAWFDAVYLHRDVVCLGCHNSEFSVTGSPDPAKNRHFALPGLLEKSLFGASTGPATYGGYEGVDRMHAPLRFNGFVNTCTRTQTQAAAGITCPDPNELAWRCSTGAICDSEYKKRLARPWGWVEGCGKYTPASAIKVDMAEVEAKFGNLTGLRTSAWDLSESLRVGFAKLRAEGLGVDENGEVPDPDKAFAYLTAMRISENVWLQIVGTPLTIPTRFPRNAAARDQLLHLTETFVRSGFSNQKLIEAVLASPYANIAPPAEGCGSAYSMPALFDPWVIAEEEVHKKNNNAGDGVVSLSARTASSVLYSALGWAHSIAFPIVPSASQPTYALYSAERSFQTETGFFLKNSESGFRGFDFQARLGWENRFATCEKLPSVVAPDFIDRLVGAVTPSKAKVRDLVVALKDRLIGDGTIDDDVEKAALEEILGGSLDEDASALPDAITGLRKVCGVIVSSPQFVLSGIPPRDGVDVPKLTPESVGYSALCTKLEASLSGQVSVECPRNGRLTLVAR